MPALELHIRIGHGIVHADGIIAAGHIRLDQFGVGAKDRTLFVFIGDDDGLEDRGIIIDLIAILHGAFLAFRDRQPLSNRSADRFNGQFIVLISRIILCFRPAIERVFLTQIPGTGIIEYLCKVSGIRGIRLFDADRDNFAIMLMEVDKETVQFLRLANHVHREAIGIDGDAAAAAALAAALLQLGAVQATALGIAAKVPDGGGKADILAGNGQANLLAISRLNMLTLLVQNINIQDRRIDHPDPMLLLDSADVHFRHLADHRRDAELRPLGEGFFRGGNAHDGIAERDPIRVSIIGEIVDLAEVSLRHARSVSRGSHVHAGYQVACLLILIPQGYHRRGEQAHQHDEHEQNRKYPFLHCVSPPDAKVIQNQILCISVILC